MEVWKDIQGYEGYYKISNLGRIKSCERVLFGKNKTVRIKKESILNPIIDNTGYLSIMFCINYHFKRLAVHRLLAQTFIPNPENKGYVNHKDGNKLNNNLDNLEWVTAKENTQHAIGLNLMLKGEHCHSSIFKTEDVIKIRYLYNDGTEMKKICELFPQASPTTIGDILRNKTWKHLI